MPASFPFTTPRSLDNEPEAQELLASGGPVVPATMGPTSIWLALSHAACRQVLTDPRFSREEATRPGGPVTVPSGANPLVLSSMEGRKHARTRKLVAAAFSPRMVATLEPRVQAIVDSLLDAPPDVGRTAREAGVAGCADVGFEAVPRTAAGR